MSKRGSMARIDIRPNKFAAPAISDEIAAWPNGYGLKAGEDYLPFFLRRLLFGVL